MTPLAEFHPALPWALLTLAIWAVVALVRRWLPDAWEWAADLPFVSLAQLGPVVLAARKAWQALPSVAAGALLAALSSDDPSAAYYGALAGLGAPVWHECLRALKALSGGGSAPLTTILLAGALSTSWVPAGCGGSLPRVEEVRQQAQDVVRRADTALVVLYTIDAMYLDSLASPTEGQLAAARARGAVLDQASDAVQELDKLTRDDGDVAQVVATAARVVSLLDQALAMLEAEGVSLPPQARATLDAVRGAL